MSGSDWFQVSLSALGCLIGAGVSWLFFRAQQQSDFNQLRAAVLNLISEVRASSSVSESVSRSVDTLKELAEIRSVVKEVGHGVNDLSSRIIGEFREHQRSLLETVQAQFERHVESSRTLLRQALEKELQFLVPQQQHEAVTSKLLDLVGHAMNSMGRFQRATIEQESQVTLTKVASAVTESVQEVARDVEKVEKVLGDLPGPIALPESTGSSSAGLVLANTSWPSALDR